jgi:hypothetical protein
MNASEAQIPDYNVRFDDDSCTWVVTFLIRTKPKTYRFSGLISEAQAINKALVSYING